MSKGITVEEIEKIMMDYIPVKQGIGQAAQAIHSALPEMPERLSKEKLNQAIGQVYCMPRHAKKDVDSQLLIDIVDLVTIRFSAPEIKLPEERDTDSKNYVPLFESQFTKAKDEGWNACLQEIKRLNQ